MRSRTKRRIWAIAAGTTALVAFGLGTWLVLLERAYSGMIRTQLSGHRWDISSKLYGEPYFLRGGMPMTSQKLAGLLDDLRYRRVPEAPTSEGAYAIGKNSIDVYPRSFAPLGVEPLAGPVRILFNRNRILDIKSISDGASIYSVAIEPQLITEFYSSAREGREIVQIQRVPKTLIQAILAAEDQRFWEHPGFDMLAMVRALMRDIFAERLQGASTITQQLVKNYFLTPERTLKRKVQEIFMAWCLERNATKQQIMELYVNEIYLGQRGTISINGFAMAARLYFRKNVSDLSIEECALLAGIIRAPNNYSPYDQPEKARERRDWVLDRMRDEELIGADQAAQAKAKPVHVEPLAKEVNQAPYFADWIRRTIGKTFDDTDLRTKNYSIFTTLDPAMQEAAQETLRAGLDRLQKSHAKKFKTRRLEGCLIAVDPRTGAVRAMVGGKSYGESQFNRAADAKRQMGSVMKPIVAASALTTLKNPPLTTATMIMDEQTTFMFKGNPWTPSNFDGYHGPVNLRRVLVDSLNVPTAKIAMQTGLEKIAGMGRRLGIQSQIPLYPSISLGAFEVAPVEVAAAFSTIANGGTATGINAVREIRDDQGNALYKPEQKRQRVLSSEVAYLLIDMMKAVVNEGTGAGVRSYGFGRAAGGKTGTTNDMRDAWFVGFVPQLLTVVWIGFDDNSPVGLTGSQAAVPIWAEFMSKALAGTPEEDFFIPERITFRAIDPINGTLATALCHPIDILPFIEGTEPGEFCRQHGL